MGTTNLDIIILIVGACLALLLLLIFIISFLFIYKNRQTRNDLELKGVKEKYDQEILRTQLEIREQTLKNIAEEIHDNMGQVLSTVVLTLSSVEFKDLVLDTSRIDNSTNLVKRVITDLRNLSKTLDSENITRAGLPTIIRYELELLDKSGLYHTRFTCSGQEQRLEPSRETVAYRIVQESLNNVIKHAQATEVSISVDFTTEDLRIGISDNGIGFDANNPGQSGHHPVSSNAEIRPPALNSLHHNGAGLKNMRNRVKLIGAALTIDSAPATGTRITLIIPMKRQ